MIGGKVAVVEIHGAIGSKMVKDVEYARIFKEIENNKTYKSLLVDIDSPGGTVSGSDVLHRSIERVARQKPVVAFVRGMGASGGYHLCCAAHQVYAMPSALVGSIGVILVHPVAENLMGRLGVNLVVYKSGEYKDIAGFWRNPTEQEATKMQKLSDEAYNDFINVVARGRKMPPNAVRELATGEVMFSRQAREAGLIDHIGDFDDALNAAAVAGKTKPNARLMEPKRKLSDKLLSRLLSGSEMAQIAGGVQQMLAGGLYYIHPSYLMWNR